MTQLAMGDTRKTDVCRGCYAMLQERKVGIFIAVLYVANGLKSQVKRCCSYFLCRNLFLPPGAAASISRSTLPATVLIRETRDLPLLLLSRQGPAACSLALQRIALCCRPEMLQRTHSLSAATQQLAESSEL